MKITPVFPAEVWDGVRNADRKSQFDDINPDAKDYDTLAAEVVAIEQFITDTDLVINSRKYILPAGENITAGAPVYIKTGQLYHAQAIAGLYQIAGFAGDYTLLGANCKFYSEGKIELTDWSAVTGTITLTVGANYFLSGTAPGKITTTPPVNGYVVKVGRAMSATKLDVETFHSIKL